MVVKPLIIQTKLCFSLFSIQTCLPTAWRIGNFLISLELTRKLHKFTHKTRKPDGFSLREFFTGLSLCDPLVIFIGKAKSINCLAWIQLSENLRSTINYERIVISMHALFSLLLTHTLVFSNWSINVFELSLSAHLNIPHSALRI